jgi:site-specific recombinase XerD
VPFQVREHYGTDALRLVLKAFGDRTWSSLRDRASVLTLLDTGVRASELMGLRLDDVNLDDQTLKVTGKGSKQRLVPIGNAEQQRLVARHRRVREGRVTWLRYCRRVVLGTYL